MNAKYAITDGETVIGYVWQQSPRSWRFRVGMRRQYAIGKATTLSGAITDAWIAYRKRARPL